MSMNSVFTCADGRCDRAREACRYVDGTREEPPQAVELQNAPRGMRRAQQPARRHKMETHATTGCHE